MGTLPYMSPEQIAGDPEALDTRSDVYSLGVILHELLCGALPIDTGDTPLPEAVRRLTEEVPSRLGRRHGRFRGDVETIVSKALEKEPDRRYTSAAEFAGDLRRFLRNEPITARPASRVYQLGRFARRNRALVTAAVLVFSSLLVGLVAERVQRRAAERARNDLATSLEAEEKARAELSLALQGSTMVTRFVTDLLASASPSSSGRDVTVRDKLAGVEEKLKEFGGQPSIEAEIRVALGQTFVGLGEFEAARTQYERAVALYTQVSGSNAPLTYSAQTGLSTALLKLGKMEEGEATARRAYEGLRRAVGEFHLETLSARTVLASAHKDQDRPEAESELREVVAACREHLGVEHAKTLNITNNLAILLREEGRFDEAEPLLREILDRRIATLGERHPDTITSRNNLGYLLNGRQLYEEALPHLEAAYHIGREVLGDEHPNTRLFGNNLGVTYYGLGRFDEVRPFFEANVRQSLADLGPDHRLTLIAKGNLAGLLRKTGQVETALAQLSEVVTGMAKLYPPGHPNLVAFEMLQGLCYRDLARYTEAEVLLLRTLHAYTKAFGLENPRTRDARKALVVLYEAWGRPESADPYRELPLAAPQSDVAQ